ncbi:GspMb/PilO family protein [Pseudoalteromonas sp. T1lg65]|uniref:GspMb/PilO family protein n=1 Tax=Pseudoalteromonas sp. T1lg65 TaxID=2077101 RepID=UPI003F7A5E52
MIEQLKQHKLLLAIVLILVSLKFVIVPLFTWQNKQLDEIAKVQLRLTKAERIMMQQQEIDSAKQLVETQQEQYQTLFSDWQAPSTFKIDAQKSINQWLDNFNLNTNSVGWQPALKFSGAQLHREQMRLNISGELSNLGQFLVALEKNKPLIAVEYLDLSVRGLSPEEGGNGEASLLLSFYMNEGVKSE